jgi:ankyrin repeat protein
MTVLGLGRGLPVDRLTHGISHRELEIMSLLLEHGADVNARGYNGRTLSHMRNDSPVLRVLGIHVRTVLQQ